MRKILTAILALALLFSLAACGNDGGNAPPVNNGTTNPPSNSTPGVSQQKPDSENKTVNNSDWDTVIEAAYREQLPKPEVSLFVSAVPDGYRATILGDSSEEYMLDYIEQVKEAGFTIGAIDKDDHAQKNYYRAKNANGYTVIINVSEQGTGSIDILKQDTNNVDVTVEPGGSGNTTAGNTSGKPTKEELLARYGLTMEDLQPPGFIEMNAWACENDEGDFFIQVDEVSRSVAEIEEWFIKVFEKLKSLSDDGKIYQDPALTQEATYPSYNAYITDKQILFSYKGQKVYVELRFNQGFANLTDEIKNKAQYEFYINLYQ